MSLMDDQTAKRSGPSDKQRGLGSEVYMRWSLPFRVGKPEKGNLLVSTSFCGRHECR
jgi:hypothetical protein